MVFQWSVIDIFELPPTSQLLLPLIRRIFFCGLIYKIKRWQNFCFLFFQKKLKEKQWKIKFWCQRVNGLGKYCIFFCCWTDYCVSLYSEFPLQYHSMASNFRIDWNELAGPFQLHCWTKQSSFLLVLHIIISPIQKVRRLTFLYFFLI